MKPIELITKDQMNYWTVHLFESIGLTANFYCRTGGTSRDDFSSLNSGYHLGDDPEHVKKNRLKIYQTGSFGPHQPVLVKQIHGNHVIHVDKQQSGEGWLKDQDLKLEGDGLVTTDPGLPLAIKTADCLPVMLADDQGRAVAIMHAGWRGLVNEILNQGVQKIQTLLSIESKRLLAILGPCISAQNFTVTSELFNVFTKIDRKAMIIKGETGFVDMHTIARTQLLKLGLIDSHIIQVPGCTFAEPEHYFSYRRDQGTTGRMLSMIQINQ